MKNNNEIDGVKLGDIYQGRSGVVIKCTEVISKYVFRGKVLISPRGNRDMYYNEVRLSNNAKYWTKL